MAVVVDIVVDVAVAGFVDYIQEYTVVLDLQVDIVAGIVDYIVAMVDYQQD
jgi:hypothetical protein